MLANDKKQEFRVPREELNVRSMGISNFLYRKGKPFGAIQFYDFDGKYDLDTLGKILEIFPNDCICYKTLHGTHFISFTLWSNIFLPKAKAIRLTKDFGNQDYWTEDKELCLRVSEKWVGKRRKVVSYRPKFNGILKYPQYRGFYSGTHLNFYSEFLGLPEWALEHYQDGNKRWKEGDMKIYHYKTRI